MKRIIQHSFLKPEKVEEYVELHANPWPELMDLLKKCNIQNYSISLRGTELYTYMEYVGNDYEADMQVMDASPVMQEWWKHSKPCFLYHEDGIYYDDMREVFYLK